MPHPMIPITIPLLWTVCACIEEPELRFPFFEDTSHRYLHTLNSSRYLDIVDLSLFQSRGMDQMLAKGYTTKDAEGFFDAGSQVDVTDRNCYLVDVKPAARQDAVSKVEELLRVTGSELVRGYSLSETSKGFKVCFPQGELPLKLLRGIKWIDRVERDQKIRAVGLQKKAPWGLAALSTAFTEKSKDNHGSFAFEGTGKGVNVYLVDSGIVWKHPEFSGRASVGFQLEDNGYAEGDCAGHGTEVASVLVGKNVGVAKEAQIIAVSVLDCNGEGTNSDLVIAVEWILKNYKAPAVINMSVGGSKSRIVDAAIRQATAKGIPVVVAAGNSNTDACSQSPSNVESAIVVGASTPNRQRASFSNFGACVDLFAPGLNILVANGKGLGSQRIAELYSMASGTSLSAPFVCGIVALLLEKEPTLTPGQIQERLTSMALKGRLSGNLRGSPNLLAQAPPPPSGDTSSGNYDPLPTYSPSSSGPESDGMSATAIALMASGIVVGLLLIVGLVSLWRRRRRH